MDTLRLELLDRTTNRGQLGKETFKMRISEYTLQLPTKSRLSIEGAIRHQLRDRRRTDVLQPEGYLQRGGECQYSRSPCSH